MSNYQNNIEKIAQKLGISDKQIAATLKLLDDGATIPFIARYRKEATGLLDEVAIAAIRDSADQFDALDQRRQAIVKSLTERSLLSAEISAALEKAESIVQLEDIYLPYKQKKKTRATTAKEAGLEPLAQLIYTFQSQDPVKDAEQYVSSEKQIDTADDALKGARDIISEWISEDRELRKSARGFWENTGVLESTVIKNKEADAQKFRDYFNFQENLKSVPSHRALALLRGEAEDFLRVKVVVDADQFIQRMEAKFVRRPGKAAEQIKLAVADAYKRLLAPSMETEVLANLKERADQEAIKVFAD
ncbi:MAG TPA: Tex-like N-terminal domain-containing protein, partial [Chroococcales cyanobacterium]